MIPAGNNREILRGTPIQCHTHLGWGAYLGALFVLLCLVLNLLQAVYCHLRFVHARAPREQAPEPWRTATFWLQNQWYSIRYDGPVAFVALLWWLFTGGVVGFAIENIARWMLALILLVFGA